MGMWLNIAVIIGAAILIYPYIGGGPSRTLKPSNPEDPITLPENASNNRVLVIGGGVAGLTAALELAERGYDVTIKESKSYLGGRFGVQTFRTLGEEFQLSSGFHAWFHNYHNFKRIRKQLDVEQYFIPWIENHFAFRDYQWENIYSSGPWPLSLIGVIWRSPNLNLWTAMKSWRVSMDFIMYDHNTVYEQYDHLTYDEWASFVGVVPQFGDIWLKPGISASFNNITKFSAAEFLLYSHFYFISVPEAEHREYSTVNFATSLINPWIKRLKKYGVKFELDKAVRALVVDPETGKISHEASSPSIKYDHVILAVDLGAAKDIISETRKINEKVQKIDNILGMFQGDLEKLPMAQPFKILKVWFDKQLQGQKNFKILQSPQHSPINVIVQLHLVERQYKLWAEKTGGSVLEFHLYSWKYGVIPDREMWDMITPTVYDIYPEISDRKFKILSQHVLSCDVVASFEKGTAKYRPLPGSLIKYGIPNLSLAGDWLRTNYPSALSERAVSTGIEAANIVLLNDEVQQVPLIVTTSHGPGFV